MPSPLLMRALLLSAGLSCLAPFSGKAALQITELMADNVSTLADEDGTFPDWIEVFNPDAAAVDLSGYTLTDDSGNPLKWSFPAVTLQPGSYLVVFCSGKNRAVAGQPLHTGFSLAAGGEYLGLFAPGNTAAPVFAYSPAFPGQSPGVSYGTVSSVPGASATYFNTPTPGSANNTATATAEPVGFSLTSRTFTSGFSVTLSVVSPTATVRYTTNGAVPTAASPQATGPVSITNTTTLRARAFEPGRPDGPVRSEIYFYLDAAAAAFTSPVPIVVTHGTGTLPTNDATVAGTIMIFEPKADNLARLTNLPDTVSRCTLERRGSSTQDAAKYSMTLEFQDESNNDRDLSPLGLPADSDWVMHAPFQYDRSLLHNDLIYRLSNDSGRYAVRTRYVELFHAGTGQVTYSPSASPYFGVYSFMEKIGRSNDRVDVEKIAQTDNSVPNIGGGYMIKVDRLDPGDIGLGAGGNTFGWVYPKERSTDPTKVVTAQQSQWLAAYLNSFNAALNSSNYYDPVTGYAQYLDVGAAIDHHILNTAAKNADAFRLSGYLHKPRFGKITYGPIWDFDRAQGSTDGRDLLPTTWRGDKDDLGTDFFHYSWYNRLFQDRNFWQNWIDRLHELRSGPFSTANVHAAIDQLAGSISPGSLTASNTPASRNFQRWAGTGPRGASATTPGTNGTWAGEIAWLKNWWASRLSFMDGQFTRPAVAAPAGGPVAPGSTVTLTSPSTSVSGVKIYYTADGSDPRRFVVPGAGPLYDRIFIAENSALTATVPSADIGTAWRGADLNSNGNNWDDFTDTAWSQSNASARPWQTLGTVFNGVGYDDSIGAGAVNYLPYINIRFGTPTNAVAGNPQMRNVNKTCFIRYKFEVTAAQLANLGLVRLRARFDDGFIAYLNGVEVARFNEPAGAPAQTGFPPSPVTPSTWNSGARTTHDDNLSIDYQNGTFDINGAVSLLHTGNNVLAIHGLNSPSGTPDSNSTDFLFQCNLVGAATPVGGGSPEIAAAAVEYTGPVPVGNAPLGLFVRTFNPAAPSDPPTAGGGGTGTVPNGSGWSAPARLYYFPGSSPAAAGNLRITEVHYHPSTPTAAEEAAGFTNSNDFEFIRLTNFGTAPVDLTGIWFSSGVEFTAAPGLGNWLPAGTSVVIVENTAGYASRYGTERTVLGQYNGDLRDSGEELVLRNKIGDIICSFTYDDTDPWPTDADGAGPSLLYFQGDMNFATSWRASADPSGLPVSFAAWQRRYFTGAEIPAQNLSADTDFDSINNLGEYAFATDPRKPGALNHAALTAGPAEGPGLSIRRRRAAADISWVFEYGSTLGSWTTGGAPVSVTDNGDGTETAVYRAPFSDTRQFLRLRATTP